MKNQKFSKGNFKMKKYATCATKLITILTIVSIIILGIGIILTVINSENTSLQFSLTILGGLMSILFITFLIAEKSRTLLIDSNKIVFPRGTNKNGKIVFQKMVIKLNEICSVESKLYKGDKIVSGDCFFHTLQLKDGTKITITLYAYGKNAEKEILDTIKKSQQSIDNTSIFCYTSESRTVR